MENRARLELAAAIIAAIACVAFVVSFATGLRSGASPVVDEPAGDVRVVETNAGRGRLEVLNASGRSGLARAATDQLRAGGFDVVYFGNAPASAGDSSVVIDRIGKDAIARAAADHLHITRTRSARDTTLLLDATVIIGKDWPRESERVQKEEGWKERIGRWLGKG